jgi:wyosine [tRNA(Phe)-imidazoG37] synthetase (radical SAM superfamily)
MDGECVHCETQKEDDEECPLKGEIWLKKSLLEERKRPKEAGGQQLEHATHADDATILNLAQ